MLDNIVAATKKRAEKAKAAVPLSRLRQDALAMPRGDFRFEAALRKNDMTFICEIKKASPSKGVIAADFDYLNIAREYEAAGADAISVLTEPDFFQGSDSYLQEIKALVSTPLLRKDFTIDEYQIYEAKLLGADAVLLIVALLEEAIIREYLRICDMLGLCALVEAHNAAEVGTALSCGAKIIGVNNRDLTTFSVDFETCLRVRPMVPKPLVFVAESGIKTAGDINRLREANVNAALIGETLMRSADKKAALRTLKGLSAS
jgi:indole-3-glycerol phosphate synthase